MAIKSHLSPEIKQPSSKIALGVEYEGTHYFGWQKQLEVPSIQAHLERALSVVANEPVTVFCAGRTDTGVHAIGQVIHFETQAKRVDHAWIMGVNSHLPSDIAIQWIKYVDRDFHARFSAIARSYRYIIYNYRYRSAVFHHGCAHVYMPLEAERMHLAGQNLLGENDFSAFRAVQCQSKTPWRNLMHLNVKRKGDYVIIDVIANAFVHHMVRNIVGSLIEVGCGNRTEQWIAELLHSKDRTLAAATAKASGLYLTNVDYPDCYQLPKANLGIIKLPNE